MGWSASRSLLFKSHGSENHPGCLIVIGRVTYGRQVQNERLFSVKGKIRRNELVKGSESLVIELNDSSSLATDTFFVGSVMLGARKLGIILVRQTVLKTQMHGPAVKLAKPSIGVQWCPWFQVRWHEELEVSTFDFRPARRRGYRSRWRAAREGGNQSETGDTYENWDSHADSYYATGRARSRARLDSVSPSSVMRL